MNSSTDQHLLREYTERRSEASFAELVRRHVDFVYSAALRMVRDAHLAEDVTQGVFVALAHNARQLTGHPVLSGWLHRTARNLAANVVRSDVRRRAREQEAAAMNELLSEEPEAVWAQIAPDLDAALGELNDADRDAVLLRYFEGKSAQEMAQTLGVSDEAAQKRVSRAVERLREFFAKRGVTVGASGLVVVLSANAVQAAPLGLAATISTAVAFAAAAQTSTVIATSKLIVMTTLQKTLIIAALGATVGIGVYEARQNSRLRDEIQTLRLQQAPLTAQIDRLQKENGDVASKLAALQRENERWRQDAGELAKLRGEVTRLRQGSNALAQLKINLESTNNSFVESVMTMVGRAAELNNRLEQAPEQKIPELQLLSPNDWLNAVKNADFRSEVGTRQAFSELRQIAKEKLYPAWQTALSSYIKAHNGEVPNDISELAPYFETPMDDAIIQRYTILRHGNANQLTPDDWIIREKAVVDKDHDSLLFMGVGSRKTYGTGEGVKR